MQPKSPWRVVGVSVAFELLFIAILALWWIALLPNMLRRMWPSIRRSAAWCRRPWGQTVDNEMDARIRKHMALKRLERLKLIVGPALYPIPVLVVYSLAQAVQGAFTSGTTWTDNSVVGLNFEGLAISLLSLFTVTWPKLADRVLTLRLLDTFMMLLFLAVGSHTIPASDSASNYVAALNQSITVQMLLAMCLGDGFRVGLVNVANFSLQLAVLYIPNFPPLPPETRSIADLGNLCTDYEVSVLWRILWNAIFTQLVAVMAAQVLKAEAQAIIGEMEASRSQTTAAGLLSVMCDAVVALRKDFTFRGDCSRLMACLMMRERTSPLDPSPISFLKYISEEGQDRFKELIEAQEGAGTFHMHLVDSLHRKVPVQVFHTKWIDADNEVNYLLGIQEEGEVDHYPSAPSLPKLDQRRAPDQGPTTAVSVKSDAQGSRKSTISGVTGWNAAGVSCVLRVGLNLEIMKQSDECKALFGFEDNILSHLDEGVQMRFVDWLKHLHVRKMHHGRASFGEMNVRSSTGIAYKANLDASLVTSNEVQVSPLDTVLELSLAPPGIRRAPTDKELVEAVVRQSPEQRRRLQARASSLPAVLRAIHRSGSEPVSLTRFRL